MKMGNTAAGDGGKNVLRNQLSFERSRHAPDCTGNSQRFTFSRRRQPAHMTSGLDKDNPGIAVPCDTGRREACN